MRFECGVVRGESCSGEDCGVCGAVGYSGAWIWLRSRSWMKRSKRDVHIERSDGDALTLFSA